MQVYVEVECMLQILTLLIISADIDNDIPLTMIIDHCPETQTPCQKTTVATSIVYE